MKAPTLLFLAVLLVACLLSSSAAPDVAARDLGRTPTLARRQDSADPNAGKNDDEVVTMTTVVPAPTDDQQSDPVMTVVVPPPQPSNKPTQPSSPDKKDEGDGDSTNVTVIIVVVVVVVVVVAVAVGILVFRKWKLRLKPLAIIRPPN
ncbi:hypothetical protein H4R34_005569 [Dimargaris verticillata]|uniref:Mid2 domain-containing protein n=1 Tax=Dimargaris verticillata TaxID=2761393 RepID=A0A9W8E624_9FUNG|nr:hypothetical protein H4R34_005569 [Dimargaris verticillata]